MVTENEILEFWFKELNPSQWFAVDEEVDFEIRNRFSLCLDAAKKGELFNWRKTPQGRLAEIIILDQFSRNIYRSSPLAFAQDGQALVLAQEVVALNLDADLSLEMRTFIYLPYMHSESVLIHQEALKLLSIPGLELDLKFEIEHKDIIDRFHRYPHRNAVLGRESTKEEIEFLKTHSGF